MAEAEQPERLGRAVTVADIRQLTASSTPHFALQIRGRIRRLISGLPAEDPARVEGEKAIAQLEEIAVHGELRGPKLSNDQPMPSLRDDGSSDDSGE